MFIPVPAIVESTKWVGLLCVYIQIIFRQEGARDVKSCQVLWWKNRVFLVVREYQLLRRRRHEYRNLRRWSQHQQLASCRRHGREWHEWMNAGLRTDDSRTPWTSYDRTTWEPNAGLSSLQLLWFQLTPVMISRDSPWHPSQPDSTAQQPPVNTTRHNVHCTESQADRLRV